MLLRPGGVEVLEEKVRVIAAGVLLLMVEELNSVVVAVVGLVCR